MIRKAFLLIITSIVSCISFSQLINSSAFEEDYSYEKKEIAGTVVHSGTLIKIGDKSPQNIIKLEILPLTLLNFKLHYERVLTSFLSTDVTLGLMPSRRIPLIGLFSFDSEVGDVLEKARMNAFTFSPDFRFYLGGKEIPRGFYIAPYFKLSTFGISSEYMYSNDYHDVLAKVEANFTRVGGGIIIGKQWFIGKSISFDLTWLAVGIDRYTTKGKLSSDEFTDYDLSELNVDINTDFEFGTLETELGSNYIEIIHKVTLPGSKFNFSIGYAF